MTLHTGDCLDVMPTLAAGSVDAVVTDPPYNLTSIGQRFGKAGSAPVKDEKFGGRYGRLARGFMGKEWDGDGVAFDPATWEAVGRVARPGAYLLAFGGTRTVHRMTCAIEDAGWVIRDVLVWAYAQGFPKSKASLKPAWEPIVMARKPGASLPLQIDAARIGYEDTPNPATNPKFRAENGYRNERGADASMFQDASMREMRPSPAGRWPANVVLTDPIFDGDVPGVVGGGWQRSPDSYARSVAAANVLYGAGMGARADGDEMAGYGDTGTYSRFFMVPRSAMPSGTMGTCERCGAPTAGSSASSGIPASNAGSAPLPASALAASSGESNGPDAPAAGSPSPSPETVTAPSRARTRRAGMPVSTASAADPSTASDTNGTETSTWPELEPATASPSAPPARTVAQPPTSTGTTTTTAVPSMCERCADDAMHGRTLPQRKPTRPALPVDGDDYTRFLIIPKADRAEREPLLSDLPERVVSVWGGDEDDLTPGKKSTIARRNTHPTVKPIDLMRHLVRLVTPPGGLVLDPFLGSGTTALACEMEGFPWIGIEREPEYVAIAEARLLGTQRGMGLSLPVPRSRA